MNRSNPSPTAARPSGRLRGTGALSVGWLRLLVFHTFDGAQRAFDGAAVERYHKRNSARLQHLSKQQGLTAIVSLCVAGVCDKMARAHLVVPSSPSKSMSLQKRSIELGAVKITAVRAPLIPIAQPVDPRVLGFWLRSLRGCLCGLRAHINLAASLAFECAPGPISIESLCSARAWERTRVQNWY